MEFARRASTRSNVDGRRRYSEPRRRRALKALREAPRYSTTSSRDASQPIVSSPTTAVPISDTE